jgi:hypothetical protein
MSLLAINLDGGMTDAGLSLAPIGAIFNQSGVLKSGSFTVSALGSPGMFVEVSGSDDNDIAIIKTSDGSTYYIKNTLALQVAILSNSSGVTKTDAIVLYVDRSAGDDENAGSPGAAHVIAVRRGGVSTGAPTNGEIDAATSNNPWLKLREVTVTNGAGQIEGPNLGYTAARAYIKGEMIDPASVTPSDGTVTNAKLSTATGQPGAAWQTWSPTLTANGSMTLSSVTVNRAEYRIVGKKLEFNLAATFTVGGTPNTTISFTLPQNPKLTTAPLAFAGLIVDGGNVIGATSLWSVSSAIGQIRKVTDSTNWSSGSLRQIAVHGSFEI